MRTGWKTFLIVSGLFWIYERDEEVIKDEWKGFEWWVREERGSISCIPGWMNMNINLAYGVLASWSRIYIQL